MSYMTIKCIHCGNEWEVYERNFTDDANRYCPHCGKEIDASLWDDAKSAFGSFVDLNCDLVKHSSGYNAPLFQVDFMTSNIRKPFKRKGKKKK